ncbi:MAG: S8 family serine peptidase [Acidobacteria bacterium]|nr:S8 family serine peptidase [Acidobacteriota bacterium]
MRRVVLLLAFGVFAVPAFAAGTIDRPAPRVRHVVLAPRQPLTDADRAELAARGITLGRALTGDRFIARMNANASVDARVATVAPFTLEEKVLRSAWREAASGTAFANVSVFFHDDVDLDAARAAIEEAGGATVDPLAFSFAPMHRLEVRVPPSSLAALASDDRVLLVGAKPRFQVKVDNAEAAQLSHVNSIQAAPYGLTGNGVVLSLFELAAAQGSHPEFGGRLTVFATGGASSDASHATHTSGTLIATGLNPEAKGMAPRATLYEFCVATSTNTCKGDFFVDKDQELQKRGVIADSNSWGYVLGWSFSGSTPVWNNAEEYYGAYTPEDTAPVDDISIRRNVLFVHSAGNDGFDPLSGEWKAHRHVDDNFQLIPGTFCYSKNGTGTDCPTSQCNAGCDAVPHHAIAPFDTMTLNGAAKNAIAVGNVDANGIVAFDSSRGPAKDGRVKPDVVARGTNVFSTVPIDSYGTKSGTSMSTPVVTGTAGLLTEQWRRTYGVTPLPVELKTLLIAGAFDLGNAGPDYTYGFGLIDAKASADLILADGGSHNFIRRISLSNGARQEFPIVVSSLQKLRVVAGWADPSVLLLGNDGFSAKALVNDLDLTVIDPDGKTHFPYVLDKNVPSAVATVGVNNIDNTEEVEIANATPGVYRVVLNGTHVTTAAQEAVVITSAHTLAACNDLTEPNDSPAQAYGALVPGSTVSAAICSAGDVDYFKFTVAHGPSYSATITAGDTPLRATSGSVSVDVPVHATATLQVAYPSNSASEVTVQIAATGPVGVEPQYTIVPHFVQPTGPRHRAVR